MVLPILKAKHIAENFPVRCETEGDAIEIIKKLLDSYAKDGPGLRSICCIIPTYLKCINYHTFEIINPFW
jgi:hypothetical protein